MKNIIFLDLDGPMIPWWGIDCKDSTGKGGRIIKDFPFLSKFHPEAINHLRIIAHETNSVIVTNSTHNGGHNNGKYNFPDASHIMNVFEANAVEDLLIKFSDLDRLPPETANFYTLIASGYKNPDYVESNRNRVRGIKSWFARWANYIDTPPAFLAIDDDNEDFQSWKYNNPEDEIPFLWVGNHLNADLAVLAIKMLKEQPNYVAKK